MPLVLACCLAACGSSGARAPDTRSGDGKTVAVLYAGSLVNLFETEIEPGFQHAHGYTLEGFPGGSAGLAEQIKAHLRQGDVFVSASPQPDRALMGAGNGSWVSWYAAFATSPLLIAYNPHSAFAAQLRSRPWWQVVTEPGFRLGRTDPALDPKGVLAVKALEQAAAEHHDSALARLVHGTACVFPEEALVGRLQAGQLDAGFFYAAEADAVKPRLPTVSIAPVRLSATYTVTVLHGAPNLAGASAFVSYLLGTGQRSMLTAAGVRELATPRLVGSRSAMPAGVRQALSAGR